MSFVEVHEERSNKELINEKVGFELDKEIQVCGWKILVKIYLKSETYLTKDGEESRIIRPETVSANDKYTSNVGLVLAMGPYCFTGEQYKDHVAHCKVGDFIHFSQTTTSFMYKGVVMKYIFDSAVSSVIAHPEYIQLA